MPPPTPTPELFAAAAESAPLRRAAAGRTPERTSRLAAMLFALFCVPACRWNGEREKERIGVRERSIEFHSQSLESPVFFFRRRRHHDRSRKLFRSRQQSFSPSFAFFFALTTHYIAGDFQKKGIKASLAGTASGGDKTLSHLFFRRAFNTFWGKKKQAP